MMAKIRFTLDFDTPNWDANVVADFTGNESTKRFDIRYLILTETRKIARKAVGTCVPVFRCRRIDWSPGEVVFL